MSDSDDLKGVIKDKAFKLLQDFEHQSATDQKNRAQAIEALSRAVSNLETGGGSRPAWAALLMQELGGDDAPHGPRPFASGQSESESESNDE